jgi:Cupin domain
MTRSSRVAKVHGTLAWHSHDAEDELFYILKGSLTIEMEKGTVVLREGDAFVVPKACVITRSPRTSVTSCSSSARPHCTPVARSLTRHAVWPTNSVRASWWVPGGLTVVCGFLGRRSAERAGGSRT